MNFFNVIILLYTKAGDFVDLELVKKAKHGDKEALVKLIMEQKSEYYKLAYVFMKDKEDALDAMEDMIVVLYQNIHKLKKEEGFYSWSKTILVNCCKALLRKKKKIINLEEIKEEVYEGGFLEKEEQIILQKHLGKLTEKHQTVLKLRYFLDLDYETIASVVKIPVGTVKSRISSALKILKDSIGGEL